VLQSHGKPGKKEQKLLTHVVRFLSDIHMNMKHLRLITLLVCAVSFAACETNDKNGLGNAEKRELAKRQAAQQRQAESPQDEAQQNLRRAQQNIINRDGNSTRP
jgi:hypothetical protein